MATRLTAQAVGEVAEWIRRWRGPDLPVTVDAGPTIVLQQQHGQFMVFEADAVRRLVLERRPIGG
ncbi:hypothetical protein DQ384_05305 [Sphaerisporangium album]|uniref:Uncharacterized protein n=1 Tax=Sphaerisporangium album TaxID=509200 RepID=A0A367FNW9_9ACTN|nr:hypothetical protein [Sphaerisporangium album]RCG31961.1 hypothetical protein DQ384_05305 [Sphaerisporangium album]